MLALCPMGKKPISDSSVLEIAGSVDITKLSIDATEGFLLSRLMGRKQTLTEVVATAGMPADQARATIAKLVQSGIIMVDGLRQTEVTGEFDKNAVRKATDRNRESEYGDFVFPPGELNATSDLTVRQKKRVIFVDTKLSEWNHYALLGLKRTATGREIKKGYFKASKEFHPDAFFRKELGPFKPRILRIFKAMKTAYDVLNDEKQRADYDKDSAGDLTPAEKKELEALAVQKRAEKKRADKEAAAEKAKRAKRLSKNPILERLKKGRNFLKQAQKELEAGKHDEAMQLTKLAEQFLGDTADNDKVEAVMRNAQLAKARALLSRLPALLASADAEKLNEVANRLEEFGGSDGDVMLGAAKAAHAGGNVQRALSLVSKAEARLPKSLDLRVFLYDCASAAGSWRTALRAAEWLREKDPKSADYKNWVKTAKKNI